MLLYQDKGRRGAETKTRTNNIISHFCSLYAFTLSLIYFVEYRIQKTYFFVVDNVVTKYFL